MPPAVSVCVPVYNPGPYLPSALESVMAQSLADFELIVVDDASTQPMDQALAAFTDPRLLITRNTHNLGLVGNWNRCLELAHGEHIIIFHQDDLMRAGYLAGALDMLCQSPSIGFVYTDIVRINSAGDVIGGHHIAQPPTSRVMDGAELFDLVAQNGNPVCCPTVMVRRACYAQLGGFDPRLPFAADLEMWLRIAAGHRVGFIAQPLVAYRVHNAQETTHFSDSGRDYRDVLTAYRMTYARTLPPRCASTARTAYATLARQAWAMARWQVRRGKLRSAVRYGQVLGQAFMLARIAPLSNNYARPLSH